MGCGSNNSKESSVDENTAVSEEEYFIDPALVAKVEGEYFLIESEGEEIYYQEPCDFRSYDIKISESAEGSGEWSIQHQGDYYDIAKIEEKEGNLYVNTRADQPGMDLTFLFGQNEQELLYDFSLMGMSDNSRMTRVQHLDKFENRPCTDRDEIIAGLESTWFYLSTIDNETVIYIPCEETPGGFGVEDGSFDNWSGIDPFPIVSMSKENNRITMIYKSVFSEETFELVLHNYTGTTIQLGKGSETDETYVSEQAKEIYDEVEEEC